MVRENYGHMNHVGLAQDMAFADSRKVLARLEGINFDEDNQRLYTLL